MSEDDRIAVGFGLPNAEYNISQMEEMAETRAQKRDVQTWGWFVGVRELPKPTLRMRFESFFWNYLALPYWWVKDWRADRQGRGV